MFNDLGFRFKILMFASLFSFSYSEVLSEENLVGMGQAAGEERELTFLKVRFCWCPDGVFQMGSPQQELGRSQNEGVVKVNMTQGFWLGKFEITQDQYSKLMKTDPSWLKGKNMPVNSVTWNDAQEFCGRLTKVERAANRLPANWKFALPTEAQWEYACRAGSTTAYCFGNDSLKLAEYGWTYENSGSRPRTVGAKKANAWGFHDMHGNMSEWCRDVYVNRLLGGKDPLVETAPGKLKHVLRGGGILYPAKDARSACRYGNPPFATVLEGFRVVLEKN